MTPRELVFAALRQKPAVRLPRLPRCEIWIDALWDTWGYLSPADAAAALGQDCILMPSRTPPESAAWQTGTDEWGRIWQDGHFVGGAVDQDDDLERYAPPISYVDAFYDVSEIDRVRRAYPDHCLIFGTHIGPFTAGYMAMGFERFFLRLRDDLAFVHRLLAVRTQWAIAMFRKAVALGAEMLVLGDDAGSTHGPLIAPAAWREVVLPYHRQIVEALDVPVIWHSDGDISSLLPMAIEAGFAGVHGLDPIAGMDLAAIRDAFGQELAFIGNVDVRVLCATDLSAVRAEVDRCLAQSGREALINGGYMLSTCNSIFPGMHPTAVAELFRYERETSVV
jgi:uroporphyrinogen-III decarboxylase